MPAKKRLVSKRLIVIGVALALFVGLAALAWRWQTQTGAHTPPTITGFAGTVQDTAAQLHSPQKIDKPTYVFTGAITGMAKTSLADVVQANSDVTVPIAITIPVAKSAGTYNGAVELHDGTKTVASVPLTITVQTATANSIPTGMSHVTPDRIVTPAGGTIPMVKDQLLVSLAPNIIDPNALIKQVAAQTHGVIVGVLPDKHSFQLRFDVANTDDLAKKQKEFDWIIGVDSATFTVIADATKTSNDYGQFAWDDMDSPDYVHTWGQRYIGLPTAWDKTTGDKSLRIGVIDNGFDRHHPDLKNNILPNVGTGETPVGNFFVHEGAKAAHGTLVSGTICAEGNNKIGLAGVMWHCSLGLYDAGHFYGGFASDDVKAAMEQAAIDNMRVVNMSLGAPGSSTFCPVGTPIPFSMVDKSSIDNFNKSVKGALDWVKDQKKDVLWVFAAGNSCRDVNETAPSALARSYPDNVINVAAIGVSESKSPSDIAHLIKESNYGPDIGVAAPGQSIYTTTLKPYLPTENAHDYTSTGGTSLAAPFVTGVAGLVLSVHPDLTAKQVKQCIVDGAKSAGQKVDGQPYSVLNAPKALDCHPDPDPKSPAGTNQQCVFSFARLPENCSSTNPTVRVDFTNVTSNASCQFESHLQWVAGDVSTDQVDMVNNLGVDERLSLGTHTFSGVGKHLISHTVKIGPGNCIILESLYQFNLLPSNTPTSPDDL